MNFKKLKKVLALGISACIMLTLFVCSLSASAVAYNNKENGTISIKENIQVGSNYEENLQDQTANIEIQNEDNNCTIKISPKKNTIGPLSEDNVIKGKLYPFTSGIYAGKKLVGEFADETDEFKVKCVKIEKNIETVTNNDSGSEANFIIETQNSSSNESYYIKGNICDSDFNQLYNTAVENKTDYLNQKNSSERSYMDMLVELDLGTNFYTNEQNSTVESGTSNFDTRNKFSDPSADQNSSEQMVKNSSSSSKSELSDFSYANLKKMISSLKNNNSISLSTYNISSTFFTTTGWDDNSDDFYYTAMKYTNEDTDGVYYTRLTVMDVIDGFNSTTNTPYITMQVKYGVMIEYVPGTSTASLYLDDYGLKIKYVKMKIDNLHGNINDIFISSTISGDVSSNSISIPTLIGLIPKLNFAATAWSAFTTESTGKFNSGTKYFDDNVDDQVKRWDKVIRGIALNSNKVYIMDEDQRMTLEGTISYSGTAYWSYAYEYNGYTV